MEQDIGIPAEVMDERMEQEVVVIGDSEDEEMYYDVEKIIGNKTIIINSVEILHFEVKWVGFKGTTWEPLQKLSVDAPGLVTKYLLTVIV